MIRKRKHSAVAGTTKSSVAVLLTEDIAPLGKSGEIVRVKPGFARNYLLPQGLATVATDHNRRMAEQHQQKLVDLRKKQIKELRQLADNVSKYSVTLEANANKEGQLYGSIVGTDISKALLAAGFPIQPEHLLLEGPLKELGMYTIKVQVHEDVKTDVKVWVVPTSG